MLADCCSILYLFATFLGVRRPTSIWPFTVRSSGVVKANSHCARPSGKTETGGRTSVFGLTAITATDVTNFIEFRWLFCLFLPFCYCYLQNFRWRNYMITTTEFILKALLLNYCYLNSYTVKLLYIFDCCTIFCLRWWQ